ncbi:hypothetical protein [Stutzerimonas kunmingensis]|uniref:hypothetical protein n=1 Tax=Stutzerimonas kunmingensis TaxID=1211807 RepID=UPI0028B07E7B|nr:hypothetical protein [Stutzerimonas kunmingensis]
MNDTLKVAGRIGAELGAAKAENDRLRGLLRQLRALLANSSYRISGTAAFLHSIDAALSQQPEPTDTYTAVEMATAAAQGFRDGQAAVEPAAAQDDQYPPCDYCGVIPDHHPWHGSGMFNGEDSPHIHACNDCRHLLPTRPAQTAPQPEQSGLYTCIGKGGAYELIGRATTAGVLKVTGRFANEVIVYRDTESNALYCREPGDFRLRMARDALSTPSPTKRGEA